MRLDPGRLHAGTGGWHDLDGDGTRDAGEDAVVGIPVVLYSAGADGIA